MSGIDRRTVITTLTAGAPMIAAASGSCSAESDLALARDQNLTVLDFGAKRDSRTNDDSAFRAALAASARYVPAGTYSVTDKAIVLDANWEGPGTFLYRGASLPVEKVTAFLQVQVPEVFSTIHEACAFAQSRQFRGNGFVSVSVAGRSAVDGAAALALYGSPGSPLQQVEITLTDGIRRLEIVGRTGRPEDVSLFFDGTRNESGFLLQRGAGLYKLAGLSITGVGAWASHGVWNAECFGAGVQCVGEGSSIAFVTEVTISYFYYGVSARDGGEIACSPGVSVMEAGDVGFHAFNGGTLVASGCIAKSCAHTAAGLGGGFCAEQGSRIHCERAKASNCLVAGFAVVTTSAMWAQGSHVADSGKGFYANGGWLEANFFGNPARPVITTAERCGLGFHAYGSGSKISTAHGVATDSLSHGFLCEDNASADISFARAENSRGDGFHARDGGQYLGAEPVASHNVLCGFYAVRRGGFTCGKALAENNGHRGFLAEKLGQMFVPGARGANQDVLFSPLPGALGNLGSLIEV